MILTGWKEIAKYLRYGVRTVQRWDREGLPVTRINQSRRSPVVADSEELDGWILRSSRGASLPRPTVDDIHRTLGLLLRSNAGGVRFLRTEVELGLEFSEFALRTTDSITVSRNQANAQKAYAELLRFLPKMDLTGDEKRDIDRKMTRLKSNLELLRRKV